MEISMLTAGIDMMDHSTERTKSCAFELCEKVIFCRSLLLVSSWSPLFHHLFGCHDWQFLSGLISWNFGERIAWAHLNRKSSLLEFCRKSRMHLKMFAHCHIVVWQISGIIDCVIWCKHPRDHCMNRQKMESQAFLSCSCYHSKHSVNIHHI